MQGSWHDMKDFKTTSRDTNICKCKLHMNLFDNLFLESCLLAFVLSLSALQLSTTREGSQLARPREPNYIVSLDCD